MQFIPKSLNTIMKKENTYKALGYLFFLFLSLLFFFLTGVTVGGGFTVSLFNLLCWLCLSGFCFLGLLFYGLLGDLLSLLDDILLFNLSHFL